MDQYGNLRELSTPPPSSKAATALVGNRSHFPLGEQKNVLLRAFENTKVNQ